MVQKAEIVVEKFTQGITARWEDETGEAFPSKDLAVNGGEEGLLGHLVWEDLYEIFDKSGSDKVRIKLEYEVISGI